MFSMATGYARSRVLPAARPLIAFTALISVFTSEIVQQFQLCKQTKKCISGKCNGT